MKYFHHQNGVLHVEQVSLQTIAEKFGTPCYVYSRTALKNQWREFNDAFADFPHRICYAVKANSNLAVLQLFANLGSGYDIVSIGELERVLKAGGRPENIIFSGIGKRTLEIERALQVGIHCFNVESEAELEKLQKIAKNLGKTASVSLRINPDIDARTHPYIATGLKENKFGIEIEQALLLYQKAARMSHIKILGIACHLGSQLTMLDPYLEALDRLLHLANQLQQQGIVIQHLNLGGGLGVRYRDEEPPAIAEYINTIRNRLADREIEIVIEPGRAISANAGILLTRVEYLKHTPHKNFAIVDAAMNDLMRPALYHAWQSIIPVTPHPDLETQAYDIVGPVCESGDFLGKDRELALNPQDLLVVEGAGAYGFSMSSNYNTRPRAAEIMVQGNEVHLIRKRETIAELFAAEQMPHFASG